MLYWVNFIYLCNGKACHHVLSPGEISLEHAMECVERVKACEKNLAVVWVSRSEEQPDGSRKHTGISYIEDFVDVFGDPARESKVMDEREEPLEPETITDEYGYNWTLCPCCGQQVRGLVEEGANCGIFRRYEEFNFCPGCGQRIKWD